MIKAKIFLCLVLFPFSINGCFKSCSEKETITEEVTISSTESVSTETESIDRIIVTETFVNTENESGGNPYQNDSVSVNITVSGNEYIYNNQKIPFDDLAVEISSFTENYVVIIKDDFASRKAYKDLTEKLKEFNINYTEIE